jgi:hypothetical protein
MADVMEILPAGTRGGARAHPGWCFRRIHGETAGACRYAPISAAEFQADQREISAPENCDEKVEGKETFAEAVSEEVVSECPAHGLTPPTKQDCPAGVKDLESPARTIQNKIPLETFDEMYDTDDASPSARDNESVLSAGTSPSTEFTHVSPTQYVQDVNETPQVQLRGGSARATLLQTNSFKRQRGGEVELQDLKSEPDTDHGDSTDNEWHNP